MPHLLDRSALERPGDLPALRWRKGLAFARRQAVRMCPVRTSNEPYCGQPAGWNAQAVQSMVPRYIRNQRAPAWHLRQGFAADHGVRLLQDGMDLAAQTAPGFGAPQPGAAER